MNYKLLRETTDLTDDTDHVLAQSAPPGLTELNRQEAKAAESDSPLQVELVVEWIDGAGAPVVTSRGSFDASVVRKMNRPTGSGGGSLYVDAVTISGLAYRPFIVSDIMPEDEFTLLLTNMSAPGGATKARILYREII